MQTFILLFQCKDQRGIVAKLADFIFKSGGNIITADQHSTNPAGGYFFLRIEFTVASQSQSKIVLEQGLGIIAAGLRAKFLLYAKDKPLCMAVCVSKPGHCLAEILYLWRARELNVEISCVISNFPGHRRLVRQYGVPFYFIPATRDKRCEGELLKRVAKGTDFLVLARYMLILSKNF
ncbi:MAG: formyltetrahydrofolate deformylase, partial [Candidatus Omnitrophota bacterium]